MGYTYVHSIHLWYSNVMFAYCLNILFFSVWGWGLYIQVPGSERGGSGWVDTEDPHRQLRMSEDAATESEGTDPSQDWEGPNHSTPTHRVWDGVWDTIRYICFALDAKSMD